MAVTTDFVNKISGFRPDERAVRLVFVEHSHDYAALVRETLDCARAGSFEVSHTDRLDLALRDVERGDVDAVLVDSTTEAGATPAAIPIEAASSLASRVPVIVLRGCEDDRSLPGCDGSQHSVDEPSFRARIASSRLPEAIVAAVRRHRRLGQHGAAEPIVLRDPLRAFARAFARLRRSLAG